MNDTCPLGSLLPEASLHIFCCNFWTPLWNFFLPFLNQLGIGDLDLQQILVEDFWITDMKIANFLIFTIIFNIYKARNETVLDRKQTSKEYVIARINRKIQKHILLINQKEEIKKYKHLFYNINIATKHLLEHKQ